MNFNEDYVLENEFVKLRPLSAADHEVLMPFAEEEPEIWRYNYPGAAGQKRMAAYIENALEHREKQLQYPFIVFDKQKNAYAGMTRLYNFRQEFKTVEVGYTWYGKNFRGTGVNKSCKYVLFEFVFEQLGYERVGLAANNANDRSKNAMRSVGCTQEGVLRNASMDMYEHRIDIAVFSVLREEWTTTVKDMLLEKMKP